MLVYLETILGIVFTIMGLLVLKPVATLLGATAEMLPDCLTYGCILLIGITAFILHYKLV